METLPLRPRRPLAVLAAAACLLFGGRALALAITRREVPDRGRAALARARYQAGVDLYAGGRYTEAVVAFQDALKLDPANHAARLAVVRVRAELARSTAAWVSPAVHPEPARPVWRDLRRIARLDRDLGDARARLGELQAVQGRIAQLVSERRLARRLGRPFRRDAELRALALRLSALAS